jgi:hypothetical protein
VTGVKTKVLYILGSGRNGSTVLGDVLGSAPGLGHVGELHWIWDRGAGENRPCGCGERFADCPFWQKVLQGISDVEPTDSSERARLRHATLEGPASLRLTGSRWARQMRGQQRSYLSLTARLYQSIADVADLDMIVDSSKRPVYGQAIMRLDGIDVYVIHLVRDSRAVAFSWRRRRVNPDRPDGGLMARYPAWKSALGWAVWNTMGEYLRRRNRTRFLRVRYEDFVREPRGVLETIGQFVGADVTAPLSGPRRVTPTPNHSISGNPSKFSTGAVQLREDREWAAAMGRRDFWVTTVLTWPLLLLYRYPLRRNGGRNSMKAEGN